MSTESPINYAIFKDSSANCSQQTILPVTHCKCIARVIESLSYYETLDMIGFSNNDNNKLINFVQTVHKTLLNDYIHVVMEHNTHIDSIYELISSKKYKDKFKSCDVVKCGWTQRHNRNREQKDETNEDEKKEENIDNEFLFYRDLFDSIHFYFFHIYDFGLRIKQNELGIEKEEMKINDDIDFNHDLIDKQFKNIKKIIDKKTKKLGNAFGERFNNKNNKFNIKQNNNDNDGMFICSLCSMSARIKMNKYFRFKNVY